MILKVIAVGPYAENTYIVGSETTKEGVIIDPGAEAERILEVVKGEELTIKYIINTHTHSDHIGAVAPVKGTTGAPWALHTNDLELMRNVSDWEKELIPGYQDPPEPDLLLKEGDKIEVGDLTLTVLETHGHTPGGISFLGDGLVFTGDTLFNGSVGRTDFPGGNWGQLMESIRTKLLVLPEETVVLPGHGPETTIGNEKRDNPFVGLRSKL